MAKVIPFPKAVTDKPLLSEQCSQCLFWKEKSENAGECHRYPPQTYEFPPVLATEWCGEFKRKS